MGEDTVAKNKAGLQFSSARVLITIKLIGCRYFIRMNILIIANIWKDMNLYV